MSECLVTGTGGGGAKIVTGTFICVPNSQYTDIILGTMPKFLIVSKTQEMSARFSSYPAWGMGVTRTAGVYYKEYDGCTFSGEAISNGIRIHTDVTGNKVAGYYVAFL